MKKSILTVVLFLMGMTTQTFSQQNKNVAYNPGTYDRYYNSHEIRFVENGVLYLVATNGTFHFRELHDRVLQFGAGTGNLRELSQRV